MNQDLTRQLKTNQDIFKTVWNLSKHKSEYALSLEGDWQQVKDPDRSLNIQVGAGHRYESLNQQPLAYDARWNLTQDTRNKYNYDPWNRINEVQDKTGKSIVRYFSFSVFSEPIDFTNHSD